MTGRVTIYFDGGCKPNPGIMEIGLSVRGQRSSDFRQVLGRGTNNLAEWTALIWALEYATEEKIESLRVIGDSMLVISQANGLWKIKAREFLPFKVKFDGLKKNFRELQLLHVLRDKNLAGHHLEFGT